MSDSTSPGRRRWSNPSVRALAGSEDPIQVITATARSAIFEAMEQGLKGPPFDPFDLASQRKIPVVPREDIPDARTVPASGGRVVIEFNPNRPRARVRYSIAHELAHTLFPDCAERIRNRVLRAGMQHHDAELELLCNIAAAEFLMPIGSFQELKTESLSIDHLMELRRTYDVSTEALLLRIVKLTGEPCLVFSASRLDARHGSERYRVDYAARSRSWGGTLPIGYSFKEGSIVEQCTAIGYTAKGREDGPHQLGPVHIECVGIPPYPGQRFPRVAGVITSPRPQRGGSLSISYLKGDATQPRDGGAKLIAHIVNDQGLTWGAGFGLFLRKKWPTVQEEFRRWAIEHHQEFKLGATHFGVTPDETTIAHMVAQHGFGLSSKPRIRYGALRACLTALANKALRSSASAHMPRIGVGQAGGSWWIISEMIDEQLCQRGVKTTVYDLPEREVRPPA